MVDQERQAGTLQDGLGNPIHRLSSEMIHAGAVHLSVRLYEILTPQSASDLGITDADLLRLAEEVFERMATLKAREEKSRHLGKLGKS